jgi:molybdopterin synthase sulfur carrier subunit
MITVLFFAQLREQLQTHKVDLVIETPCSIAAIQANIVASHPNWSGFIEGRTLLAAVNQTMVTNDHMVNTGDEVAFFPPVTGG